ncbi:MULTISPECIES: malonate decarboxylase holo-ACP synthase [Serratia]|uniref:malonate decarboxylase holo-ACP synthase n=1 Tax=Serratia TaxID=613 RepID=UPI0009B528BF|nr:MULTISPECIES: malonate decarboxylase holo-ACP synthase [Serratia]MDR8490326.1 malonate decarboxylase holo-ACP synthase [Serratia nevei]HAU5647455.1 malonate decarboxylase holo-ACP synthase [Serratia marcescens]HBB6712925.1 malonate decarboxylase holo-ACP synthase [Serratia marcescens]
MVATVRPHDLIWLTQRGALEGVVDAWVSDFWHIGLPVVVRRDTDAKGRIPIGVRGLRRDLRAAGWIRPDMIAHICKPESLVKTDMLLRSPFIFLAPVRSAVLLSQHKWPWTWGITGSTGYSLATGISVNHVKSDLDLLIRAPQPLPRELLVKWQILLMRGGCRADTQLETLHGAFALNEWLHGGKVLLKTSRGPRLVSDPWREDK